MSRLSRNSIDASRHKALIIDILGISDPSPKNIFILLCFFVFLGWFGDTCLMLLQAWDENIALPGWKVILIGVIPFLSLLFWNVYRWQQAEGKVMDFRAKVENVQPHKAVILFLSGISDENFKLASAGDMEVFNKQHFQWSQCKRGLEVHSDTLERVWVVCSKESAAQFDAFKSLFTMIHPDVEFEKLADDGVDFSDVKTMVEHIEALFHRLPKGISETDTIIDITGGTKTASIAGMLVTLVSKKRDIQYVLVKDDQSYEVKTYGYDIKGFVTSLEANK